MICMTCSVLFWQVLSTILYSLALNNKSMNKKGKILVVDDDTRILESCSQLLKHDFAEIVTLADPNRLPSLMREKVFDVILLDMNFQASISTGNEGLFWLREIMKTDPAGCSRPEFFLFLFGAVTCRH